jgi:hypothetical protein
MHALDMRNRAIKEELAAMGANVINHYVPKRVEMPSPLTIYGGFERGMEQRKLTDVSSGLMDKRDAREMLNALTAQIDEKRGEFDTLAGSYTALSASISVNPADHDKLRRKQEMCRMSGVREIWNEMSGLRENIWNLERTRAGFLDGRRIVDGEEWMRLYDELHAELLDNMNKLLL